MILDDDGFMLIEIDGQSTRVDVFAVNNQLFELAKKFQDKPLVGYHEAILDFMVSLGFPRGSHRLASKFELAITGQVELLKKKANPSPE